MLIKMLVSGLWYGFSVNYLTVVSSGDMFSDLLVLIDASPSDLTPGAQMRPLPEP